MNSQAAQMEQSLSQVAAMATSIQAQLLAQAGLKLLHKGQEPGKDLQAVQMEQSLLQVMMVDTFTLAQILALAGFPVSKLASIV